MRKMQESTNYSFTCRVCKAPVAVGPEHRSHQFWIARCPQCGLTVEQRLPAIQKKIIYLDQFVLSNILAGKQDRWNNVYKQLQLLSYLQVIACPYSEIHQDESVVAEYSRDSLKKLYRHLSDGLKFASVDWIEHVQLRRSLNQFLGVDEEADNNGYEEFCNQDPNRWTLDMQVYADFPTNQYSVDCINARKKVIQMSLETEAEQWRKKEGHTYEADVRREAVEHGRLMLSVYHELDGERQKLESELSPELAAIYHHFTGGNVFNPEIPPSNKPYARIIHYLGCEVLKIRPNETDPIAIVEQFLASEQATKDTPYLAIMSRLRARIIQQARNPRGARKPKASDDNDIALISHFAPYCDAMVVDNHFRAVATQAGVARDFDVRFFSPKCLSSFAEYLDDCLQTISQPHRRAIKQVIPNVSMLPFLATEPVALS
jgi:transcription elongation factor Elf1